MNRLAFVVLVTFTITSHSSAFAEGLFSPKPKSKVRWTEHVDQALQQYHQTGRPMIVYVTAGYCGYCRKMERDTWSDPQVVQRMQGDLIALKVDAEQHPALVSQFGVQGLPTTILFNRKGERVQTLSGYSRSGAVIKLLDSISVVAASAAGPVATPR